METIEIHKDGNEISFFSLKIDEREVGRLMVNSSHDTLKAGYTVVDLAQRHNGYGKILVDAVVDYARKNNLKVVPECGFVAMMFKKHPETYGDIQGPRN